MLKKETERRDYASEKLADLENCTFVARCFGAQFRARKVHYLVKADYFTSLAWLRP